ncbi:MAG: substrate-binding domain-containing protein [Rhodobacteraceae bacterium]|nr:substrate-binding domain-containing protein [Paracoccaceae bacterium]
MIRRCLIMLLATLAPQMAACDSFIILQSTTSTQNSGLYDSILPRFSAETGIEVRVVAVGSGQALRNASDCNGEVVITHDPAAEAEFVNAGFASRRHDLMRNDFVLIGPGDDPGDAQSAGDIISAMRHLADGKFPFVSRGDNSGTHRRELQLWNLAGLNPAGSWYRETGTGMGATLNIAVGMNTYALTDRATWLRFGNRQHHRILFEGGSELANQYSIMAVDPQRCPGINAEAADIFLRWMLSQSGQAAIASFTLGDVILFEPNSSGN